MKKNKLGVTLIEIILYMGLLSIFMFVLIDIFTGGINTSLESKATSSVQEDNQFILARFGYDINRASAVQTPASLGSTTNTLVLTASGNTYTYALSGGNLTLSNGSETLNLNSLETNLSSISFTRIGNVGGKPTIQIKYTIQSLTKLPTQSVEKRDMQVTYTLR